MKHLKTWEYHLIPEDVIKGLKDIFNQYFKSFDLTSRESLHFELGLDDLVRRLIRNMPMISELSTDIEWARVSIKLFIEIASEASEMPVEKAVEIAAGIDMLAQKSLAYVINCKKQHKLLESFKDFKQFLSNIDRSKYKATETRGLLGGTPENGGQFFEIGDHVKLYAKNMIPYDYKTGDLIVDNDALIATFFADTVRFKLSNGEVVELAKDDVRAEKIMLKSDFSKKMVDGLLSKKDGYRYATYNAFKIELNESNPEWMAEFEYRMSDNENPVKVIIDIFNKCQNKTPELKRLVDKVSNWKD